MTVVPVMRETLLVPVMRETLRCDFVRLRIEPVENKCFHEPSIVFACMHLVCLLLGNLAVFAKDFLGGLFALGLTTEREFCCLLGATAS